MGAANNPTELLLILNSENIPGQLPKHFRTTKDHFQYLKTKIPPRDGLEALNISGSAQYSFDGLDAIYKKIGEPNKMYVVDLRQEPHGFINGIAVSWYTERDWANKGKTPSQVVEDENKRLEKIGEQKEVDIYRVVEKDKQGIISKTMAMPILVKSVSNEEEYVISKGFNYLRIFVTDHMAPTDDQVDRFITFINGLPEDAWVHIHCKAGDGRTTTFMSMVDMIHNADTVSFDDIILRQWLIGGINLAKERDPNNWKYPFLLERLDFLRKFYDYAKKNKASHFKTSWSEYNKSL